MLVSIQDGIKAFRRTRIACLELYVILVVWEAYENSLNTR
jgi:hypothetical protein